MGKKTRKKLKKPESAKQPAAQVQATVHQERAAEACPYCESKDFVKRGVRSNKHQEVQLYVCRNHACGRTFTSRTIKGKQFPWPAVLDAISYHNLGYTFEQTSQILATKRGVAPQPDTIAKWYEEYKPLCRFERLRPYALKILSAWRVRSPGTKFEMVETTTLAHRQLYRFRYHRPKLILMLEEYGNRNFGRLTEYLDSIATETPHQYFSDGERMSEVRSKFDKAEMIVKGKTNFANQLTKFVLQGVPENKERHEVLQRFMIANDSVTVATEVPVYIRREDVAHMEQVLKFKVLGADVEDADINTGTVLLKGHKRPVPFPKLLTGHIDFVQVRNGQVHLLDYKPGAAKEKPIEQLTWYAMALSRLTGLRLFEFKCAWFDEHDYFEFYPLHVVKKLQRKKTKKIHYKDGSVAVIPRDNALKIV
ncbi:MAG: hypothetical protein Q8P58_01180 [Candidatus Adlerbacteria bacterium]|nr:hypothetical protein [Candidatus Adlerbacteria bacterium]